MIDQALAIILAAGVAGLFSSLCTVAVLKSQLKTHVMYLQQDIAEAKTSAKNAHHRINKLQGVRAH